MSIRIVPDLLRQRAASEPERTALIAEPCRELSYGQWERRSNAAGRGLAARGAGVGDAVALVFGNGQWDDYAVAYLAVQKAGAAAVPVSPDLAGPQIGSVLADSGATGVVLGPEITLEAIAGAGRWVAPAAELEETQDSGPFQAGLDPSDLAEVIYTSGTTGAPKGVACSHASIVVHDGPPEPEGPRVALLHAFPIGTNACQEVLRVSLRRGDRLPIALDGFDPGRCAAAIEKYRPERLQLVPAMAQALLASGACRRFDVSSVRVITLSSAPAPPSLIARLGGAFPQARLVNTYALTEAGTARTLNPDARAKPDSVGRPVGRTQLQVSDEHGSPLPPGQVGEVWLRHPASPPRAYAGDLGSTAAAYRDGWLRTGDLGWIDDEGELHLSGRAKEVIICGGLNVSALEVEDALYEHPRVAEAAVFGVPHAVLGQQVAAAIVPSGPVEPGELRAFARTRLAEHKAPHRIAVVSQLPRTATGKVRKGDLADALAPAPDDAHDAGPAYVAPSSPEEEKIAAIWAEVLDLDRVGVHDDFFERGGHSLAAAEIIARLGEAYGVSLPVSALFERPTVAELAAAVRRRP